MIVFKYFIKIALNYKEIILIYAAIFFVFAVIATMDGSSSQYEMDFQEDKQDIGIVNNSDSQLANALVAYLESGHNVVYIEDDEDHIKEQIFLEEVNAVIVIPEDFQESVINKEESVEMFRDDRRAGAYQLQNQINKFIAFANGTYSNGEFELSIVKEALDNSTDVNILKSDGMNKEADSWFQYYYNFVSYIIVALYISVIGMIMSDFNVAEVERRRKVSSIKLFKFNREIYLGQLTIAILLTSIFIVASVILRGNYIPEVNFLKYLINTVVFSFTVLCMVFLIINITTNKFAITAIGNVLSLGLSFISGVFVPLEFLSDSVIKIARFFPIYYYVSINNKEVNSFLDMRFEVIMQLLFAFAFLMVGLYLSKVKQRA